MIKEHGLKAQKTILCITPTVKAYIVPLVFIYNIILSLMLCVGLIKSLITSNLIVQVFVIVFIMNYLVRSFAFISLRT